MAKRKKLTPEEKERRKHERSAARKNAKIQEQIPLYASQEPQHTPEGEYWHWRTNKALAVENCSIYDQGSRGLRWIEIQAIERWAVELVGPEYAAKMTEHVRRVYPMPGYGASVWCGLLTGNTKVEIIDRVERLGSQPFAWVNCNTGEPMTTTIQKIKMHSTKWPPEGWTPPITREQFYARFPYEDKAIESPDDGGLAELMASIFRPA